MKNPFTLLATLLLALLPACSPSAPSATTPAKPIVLCTIFSYFDAARAIAGNQLDIQILIPPGSSPHEYEATIDNKITAAKAQLYIKNGLALDDRFDPLLAGSKAKLLNISQQLPPNSLLNTQELSLDDKTPTPSAESALTNPHIWLDPQIQIQATQLIRDALITLDPADKPRFEQNAAAYTAALQQLDADFKTAAAAFKTKDFIGFHSAYDYLAHRYGLRQVASIEEIPGSDISIAQAQKVITLIKTRGIKYIAVETAFTGQGAKMIETETGAKEIVLQPLETYDKITDTYTSLMHQNLEALKTALN